MRLRPVAALPVQVRFLRQGNGGPAAARNLGIRAASAELLAMLNVDDLWPARKLAASLAWLADHPDTDVVLGRGQLMEASGAGAFEFVGSPADGYPLYLGSALFRRRAFERAALFDPHLRLGEDTDWFTKAEQSGARIDRLEMVTLLVRRHAANTTRNLTALETRPLRLVRNALARKRPLPADHA